MRPLFTSHRLQGLAGVALLVASATLFLAVRLVYVYKGATYKCAVEGPFLGHSSGEARFVLDLAAGTRVHLHECGSHLDNPRSRRCVDSYRAHLRPSSYRPDPRHRRRQSRRDPPRKDQLSCCHWDADGSPLLRLGSASTLVGSP